MAKKCIELQLAAIFQNPSDMDYSPMGEKPDLFLCRDFVGEALNVNKWGTPQSITLQVSTAPCKYPLLPARVGNGFSIATAFGLSPRTDKTG